MARIHGSIADVVFDSVALEDELNSWGLNFTVDAADITSFTDAYMNFLGGKPNLTIDMAGFWDSAASQGDATIFAALTAAAKTWDIEPGGGSTLGYNGYAFPTSYSITGTVSGPVTYSATFQHNGGAAAADGAAPTRV